MGAVAAAGRIQRVAESSFPFQGESDEKSSGQYLYYSHGFVVESSSGGQAGSSLNDQLIQAATNGDTATVQQLLDQGRISRLKPKMAARR